MGAVAAVLGSAAAGIGLTALTTKKPKFSYASDTHSQMQASRPESPEIPTPTSTNPGEATRENSLMEEEREKEKQQAAWRREQGKQVFTSGLGASGLAETSRKTLLGG